MAQIKLQNIYSFLNRLSKREKLVLYGAVACISLLFLDNSVVNPIVSKMEKLRKDIKEARLGIKRNTRILARKDKILAEREKYAPYFAQYQSTDEEMASLLKEIESLANKSSVYLIDIKPAGVEAVEGTTKFFINLNCEAQLEQLFKFMYSIEESSRLLTIEKYRIAPKSQESSIARCGISISKVVTP